MIVSIPELKAHLRIQHEEEDALLASLLAQAQAAAEDFCRTAFDENAPQTAPRATPKGFSVDSFSFLHHHILWNFALLGLGRL